MPGDVDVGFCAPVECKAFFQGAEDLIAGFGGDENVIGEVGCDEEDWSRCLLIHPQG